MGAHSLRSEAAMSMYLPRVTPLTILIIEKWQSDAFLQYIQKQVAQFSIKVPDKILQNKEFFTVPDFDRTIQEAKNYTKYSIHRKGKWPSKSTWYLETSLHRQTKPSPIDG